MNNKTLLTCCLSALMLCSACHKSYTCHCDGGALSNGKTITIENKTKADAQKECDSYNSSALFSYHNCVLK